MEIIIRRAITGDAAEIKRIQIEGWHDNNLCEETGVTKEYLERARQMSLPPTAQAVAEIEMRIADPAKNNYLVAQLDGAVVGWIAGPFTTAAGQSFGVYVDRKMRDKGVGSRLIEAFLKLHPDASLTIDVARTNSHAIRFYERFGFRSVGESRHYFSPDDTSVYLPVVLMRRERV